MINVFNHFDRNYNYNQTYVGFSELIDALACLLRWGMMKPENHQHVEYEKYPALR